MRLYSSAMKRVNASPARSRASASTWSRSWWSPSRRRSSAPAARMPGREASASVRHLQAHVPAMSACCPGRAPPPPHWPAAGGLPPAGAPTRLQRACQHMKPTARVGGLQARVPAASACCQGHTPPPPHGLSAGGRPRARLQGACSTHARPRSLLQEQGVSRAPATCVAGTMVIYVHVQIHCEVHAGLHAAPSRPHDRVAGGWPLRRRSQGTCSKQHRTPQQTLVCMHARMPCHDYLHSWLHILARCESACIKSLPVRAKPASTLASNLQHACAHTPRPLHS